MKKLYLVSLASLVLGVALDALLVALGLDKVGAGIHQLAPGFALSLVALTAYVAAGIVVGKVYGEPVNSYAHGVAWAGVVAIVAGHGDYITAAFLWLLIVHGTTKDIRRATGLNRWWSELVLVTLATVVAFAVHATGALAKIGLAVAGAMVLGGICLIVAGLAKPAPVARE